jgi:hypothetical protein
VTAAHPPGARYVLSLTQDDVGARVVVRRRLPEGGSGDLLGELVRWDEDVVVRDRSGVAHTVRRSDVVAAKRVPPPPVRR